MVSTLAVTLALGDTSNKCKQIQLKLVCITINKTEQNVELPSILSKQDGMTIIVVSSYYILVNCRKHLGNNLAVLLFLNASQLSS
jgi:hypothetical protein